MPSHDPDIKIPAGAQDEHPQPVHAKIFLNVIAPSLRGDDILEVSEFRVAPEVRGAIFDFDGTLFETFEAHWRPFKLALESMYTGMPKLPDDVWINLYRKSADITSIKTASNFIAGAPFHEKNEEPPSRDLVKNFLGRRREIFCNSFAGGSHFNVAPVEGALELVERLRAHGHSLALCSSSESWFIRPILEKFGMGQTFGSMITAESVPSRSVKPNPYPYTLALRDIQLECSSVVAFEDSANGALAARSAGVRAVVRFADHLKEAQLGKLRRELQTEKQHSFPYDGPAITVLQTWGAVISEPRSNKEQRGTL